MGLLKLMRLLCHSLIVSIKLGYNKHTSHRHIPTLSRTFPAILCDQEHKKRGVRGLPFGNETYSIFCQSYCNASKSFLRSL